MRRIMAHLCSRLFVHCHFKTPRHHATPLSRPGLSYTTFHSLFLPMSRLHFQSSKCQFPVSRSGKSMVSLSVQDLLISGITTFYTLLRSPRSIPHFYSSLQIRSAAP
ncbi:uncharacterized protein BDW70DRAFT_146322 [Aspergillus foveolatus]|uniref:uncharacterized protein n=1 Tax=Aspergillus foveolatus TaxID=210207 RepID=UPI003CCD6F76